MTSICFLNHLKKEMNHGMENRSERQRFAFISSVRFKDSSSSSIMNSTVFSHGLNANAPCIHFWFSCSLAFHRTGESNLSPFAFILSMAGSYDPF